MFLWLFGIVATIAVAQVILTFQELKPYFKAKREIKILYTKKAIGPFRFVWRSIKILPLMWPALIDTLVVFIAGFMGLSGSLIGASVTMLAGFATSLMIKWNRHQQAKLEREILE